MAEAPEMTKAIDACSGSDADADAPQHQKVPDTTAQPPQTQPDLATTPEPPPPTHERTPAQRKRDRKKGKNRRNNPPPPPAEDNEDEEGSGFSSTESSTSTSSSSSSLPRQMAPPKKAAALATGKIAPLFIASIGNPPPTYAHTLHSAGHTLLDAVRDARSFPAWQKDRLYANGLVSRQAEAGVARNFSWVPGILAGNRQGGAVAEGEENWTLWQSPSLMNVSGKALGQAWGRWKRENREGVLVVLHDELERALGKVVVRRGGSARGHNGLKSIAAQLPGMQYVRIGVGIGRPESREPAEVARYVLRKMTRGEQARVEGCADEVIRKLWEVQEGRL